MMVTQEKIAAGFASYIDREISPHLPVMKAIGLGTAVALYLRRLPDLMEKIPDSMGIKNDSGLVDIDALREALLQNIKDQVPIDIPFIGQITVDRAEVDKLYRYIAEA